MTRYIFTPADGSARVTLDVENKNGAYECIADGLDRDYPSIRRSSVGPDVWDGDEHLGLLVKVS